jgi:ribosomal protein L12E/L44/L45/RPP1/RPP2
MQSKERGRLDATTAAMANSGKLQQVNRDEPKQEKKKREKKKKKEREKNKDDNENLHNLYLIQAQSHICK